MTQQAIEQLANEIEALKPEFIELSDRIWELAELKFEEFESAKLQAALLEKYGFSVTRGVAGIETAFCGEYGGGRPVIAILGEFDALAGMNQVAGIAEEKSDNPGASGHGCGHNLLGAGSLLAAVGLARHLEKNGVAATVRYYGCPAEEGGGAKTIMAEAGVFDDVDLALTWHPAPFNGVRSTNNLAVIEYDIRFKGVAAHASNAAHLGRSALDALELTNIGINFLREHIPSDCRIHYAITETGGVAANVVQAHAAGRYMIRAPEIGGARALAERVKKIAEGAAMMTETSVELGLGKATNSLLPNITLETAMHEQMTALGPVPFDEADEAFAKDIQATFSQEAIDSSVRLYQVREDALSNSRVDGSQPLHRGLRAFEGKSHFRAGSTDVGDVSWVIPTAQCWTPAWAIGTNPHTWQVVAQGKSPAAHKAFVHAAKTIAATGLKAVADPALIDKTWAEWSEKTGRKRLGEMR
ncbi:M20 family metallopeptidase [Martelella endophytica]|uniref:Peptidase M20 n=1 Tax=Martelella endophytica TaxID=1486262 RepID=A0A0D5LLQ6_MAREN|nr:M20 family metallopeptidase [Martelella endophytica]AJY45134.1 peptidase M20 [Martelella endophytica]